jgi:RNA:NAD 2'-phosphotransferase (TPT1/KptA family)
MSNPSPEAFLDAEVESALAPYREMGLSAPLLAAMSSMLRAVLTTDPTARYLMNRARPRAVDGSGTMEADVAARKGDGAGFKIGGAG